MSTVSTDHQHTEARTGTRWQLDAAAQSTVEFRVRHFWGLITVTGRFDRFDGSLALAADGTRQIELTIDADSLDTGHSRRDAHLRSADFFDVAGQPKVRFTSTRVVDQGDGRLLRVAGDLEAAGKRIPMAFDVLVRELDDGLELETTTTADHRALGMTWSPLGMLRAPSTLYVKARLRRA
ncbi:MAG TPA: YceI family protein [Gaiellaceae bacterium]|jgi:polyisoprenoid-binding protein YceI